MVLNFNVFYGLGVVLSTILLIPLAIIFLSYGPYLSNEFRVATLTFAILCTFVGFWALAFKKLANNSVVL